MVICVNIVNDIFLKISTSYKIIQNLLFQFYRPYIVPAKKHKVYLAIQYSDTKEWIVFHSDNYFSIFSSLLDVFYIFKILLN